MDYNWENIWRSRQSRQCQNFKLKLNDIVPIVNVFEILILKKMLVEPKQINSFSLLHFRETARNCRLLFSSSSHLLFLITLDNTMKKNKNKNTSSCIVIIWLPTEWHTQLSNSLLIFFLGQNFSYHMCMQHSLVTIKKCFRQFLQKQFQTICHSSLGHSWR